MVRYIRKDELYHYGVKGMKWRKRRHSAIPYRAVIVENGNSLKHYGRSKADGAPGVGTGNWRRGGSSGRYATGIKQTQADSTVAKKMLSDQAVNKIQDKNRLKNIATTGLKALAKIRGSKEVYEDGEDINNPDEGNREWFLYEDQTVALPEIVDFARRGYSEKDIMGVIKEAEQLQKKDSDAFHKNELAMILVYGGGSDLEKFVKAAVETVEEEQNKN